MGKFIDRIRFNSKAMLKGRLSLLEKAYEVADRAITSLEERIADLEKTCSEKKLENNNLKEELKKKDETIKQLQKVLKS